MEQGEGDEQVVATAAAATAALSVADISHLYCNKLCAIGVSWDILLLPQLCAVSIVNSRHPHPTPGQRLNGILNN